MAKRNRNRSAQPKEKQNEQLLPSLVNVVIPVYGQFEYLQRCIDALFIQTTELFDIIIVDNNSPEGTEFYNQYKDNKRIKVIKNKANTGFSKACNRGASIGRSPLILFLNSDVILEQTALQNLIMSMDDRQVGVVGAKLIFPPDTTGQSAMIRPPGKVQHVGVFTNIRGDVFHIFVGWSADNPRVLAVKDAYAVTGAALMTRRNLFMQAGMFYEGYGLGTYEDIDYCLTIREMGYNIAINQEAIGTHYTGKTSEAYRIQYPLNENRMKFISRWATRLQHTDWSKW